MSGHHGRALAVGAALLAAAGMVVPAIAQAAPTVSFEARAVPVPGIPGTGDMLGAAVEGEGEISGTEYDGAPAPVTGIAFFVPAGAKLHPQGFATCDPSVLAADGPTACPKRSIAGRGSATGVVAFGGERVPETRPRGSVDEDAVPPQPATMRGAVNKTAWPTERVVVAAQHGDPRAIAVLVEGSHTHVRRFAHTLCATPQDAEDAAQEALVILYRKIGTLRSAAALSSWMFQIVRHECVRRMRLSFSRPAADWGNESSAEEVALARLEMERVVECIAGLPPEQRKVLVLRDVHGLSGRATARALGLSGAAMKSRLHRAREAVRVQVAAGEPSRSAGAGGPT